MSEQRNNHFLSGKDRKEMLKENKEKREWFEESGPGLIQDKGYYKTLNSPLEDEKIKESFSNTFRDVLPENEKSLKGYIENNLDAKKGDAIGVEFGGIGSNLFSGFTPGFFKKSFGVTLADHRFPEEKFRDESEFKKHMGKLNHYTIEHDIMTEELYKDIEKKLDGKKVDLIIERMFKGLEFIPREPYAVAKVLDTWYSMLNTNGIILAQTPRVFNNLLEKWTEMIKHDFKDKVDVQISIGNLDYGHKSDLTKPSTLRLRKLEGAPQHLPFLDHKTVHSIEKSNEG